MADINAAKLQRLVSFFENDGAATPAKVADILKSKPENTAYLRAYVEAAAASLTQPDLVTEFDKHMVTEEPAPAKAPKPAPVVEGEIISTAAPEPVVTPVKVLTPLHLPGVTGYRYTNAAGMAFELVEVHRSSTGIVVLADRPTDEVVTVTLKGQPVELNLTDLRRKPGGDSVTINGTDYMVAVLLTIADAAKA